MKSLISLLCVFCILSLSSCGGANYRYQTESNPGQWQGQNIKAVQKKWGDASNIMHTRSGTSYYMYVTNSSANFYRSTTTNFSMNGPNEGFGDFPLNNQGGLGLRCTTIFTADQNGMITNVSHQGSNCGGEWVPH